jgi:hypothetical protein
MQRDGELSMQWDVPPLGQMTTSELNGCLERAVWLLDRQHLMPRELAQKLDTWRVDMVAEIEDRAEREQASRQRVRAS